ncbi:type I restriction-modification system subunit M [Beijerinckia indica]|uniref:site-specific DNA-methyltransferase (adenine-specific) n=1 Tax=Beijerinckia indica subsp. indica (strain ATCC 9039 / DSM 1715 / NCIMB 8712) TaxID=395963 RepID=B2IJC6_BEII9|nr:class I SAM-dependent DNA methyltransferase [Beijerinckia indica]ACB96244.1 N-6 DNA methylase [Beijerinckia indica subsp. indica ATCC 9039]
MAVKKSEIYSSLWASCDALRGGMDASLYKDYVLVLLFVKYVSDKYAGDPNGLIEVPKGGSFADMVALKGNKDIGEQINMIIAKLAEANDLKGVIDVADFNDPDKLGSGKEMVDRLSSLVGIFNRPELDFRKNRTEGDDILGDAYEYLMRHFATESGKSKGQFYTPAEVSRIMAKAIGMGSARSAAQTIYDPTCGSGSLLLKAHDEAPFDLTIYGQEKDVATRALAKMNMVLHDCPTAEIWRDNTLSAPHFVNNDGTLKTFDFVVANPPFSDKAWGTGLDPAEDRFKRFEDGVPPAKNGDFAYLLHVVASLKSTGKGAIIMPHGVLFRGNAEAGIREKIIRKGIIKGIIGLPANLFYGTGIPACIVVLDKENAHARTGIFMIDASKGFVKDGNKNRLRAQDIHKIVDTFTKQLIIDRYSRMVPLAEIEKNDFNLNIPRYIDSSEPDDLQDIEAHLKGGIPLRDIDALANYWAVLPSVRGELFGASDRPGYASPKVEAASVKSAILNHAEFAAFSARVDGAFAGWRVAHLERLKSIKVGDHPKTLIAEIAEDLLIRFSDIPLIDKYDIYQHLMTYWSEIMQDDVYILAQEGWVTGRQIRELVKNDEGKFTETPDITLGRSKLKAELITPALIVARFFAKEQEALESLEAKTEEIARAIEEMDGEHGGEDGLLFEAKTEKGKLTAKSVKDRLKEIKGYKAEDEERAVLNTCLKLIEQEKEAADAAKQARIALETMVVKYYAKLTEAEIKLLLVEDKWLAVLQVNVASELDRMSQVLTGRVKLLTERYAVPLPELETEVEALSTKVNAHLKRMGFARK